MDFELPHLNDLHNESDVEQKLVYPLLTGNEPLGLGLLSNEVLTKQNIRRITIGKGDERKSYFPDYLIVIGGIPLAVIEAKGPNEDLDQAFREARLYATEINAIFGAGLNPLTKVVATNGARLIAGFWDSSKPKVDITHAQFSPSSEGMAELHALIGRSALHADYLKVSNAMKPPRFWKPRRMLGGIAIQQGEISLNTFGTTISAEFAHIFNPSSMEDRIRIAKEGYVPSKRRERYVDPIDKVIRAARPPSETASRQFEDTSRPREFLDALREPRQLEHQVLLIVGSVGVGKTTFIDHLQYVALPKDIVDSTVWVRVNMNNAPGVQDEIYDWMRSEIILGCRSAYPQIDFDSLEAIKAVFSVEVRKFKKGLGALYGDNEQLFNEKLADHLSGLMNDRHHQAVAYTRHCSTERGKLLVIVIDNCDKRTLDQQLLMFEVAQWTQREFRALVILPLREETYDNYRDRPPLDTALKDLVFRIEPPVFQQVLVSRVQMALSEIRSSGSETYRYDLPNGFRVEYPQSDKAYYLASILYAVFEHDREIRRIILGLAGRNIRRALEMFLEFCRSGHITEDYIFKIRQAEGRYVLPLHVVERVLLRMNRRFYDSDYSYVKNLLALDTKDVRPNHFTRLVLLRWLYGKFSQQGTVGLKGYFSIGAAIEELSKFGFEPEVIRREVEYLAKAQCIVAEDFSVEGFSDEKLIRLAPAGFVHLELIKSATYLAALAEDTAFPSEEIAKRVVARISALENQYNVDTVIANAREVLSFFSEQRERSLASLDAILDRSVFERLSDLSDVPEAIDALERSVAGSSWSSAAKRYLPRSSAVGTVVNVRDYGVFVELEPGITGLIHSSRLPLGFAKLEQFAYRERVVVEIIEVFPVKRRIDLAYAGTPKPPSLADVGQLAFDLPSDPGSDQMV